MPGAIPHITAGFLLFMIGSVYYKNYIKEDTKYTKLFFLGFFCLFFSTIPDMILIIYYTGHIPSYCTILPYHNLVHIILFIIALVTLIVLSFFVNIKSKPIWIMGMWCIILHISMDVFIPDTSTGIWI